MQISFDSRGTYFTFAESDESFDASNFTYNIPDPDDDMCSDTSTSGTDDHQEVFEELADKYRFQVRQILLPASKWSIHENCNSIFLIFQNRVFSLDGIMRTSICFPLLIASPQMGLRPASETDTDQTTSDDISSSSASELSDSSLDEVVDPKTGTKQFVPKQLDEDGMLL
jgi:hypothetical protein